MDYNKSILLSMIWPWIMDDGTCLYVASFCICVDIVATSTIQVVKDLPCEIAYLGSMIWPWIMDGGTCFHVVASCICLDSIGATTIQVLKDLPGEIACLLKTILLVG